MKAPPATEQPSFTPEQIAMILGDADPLHEGAMFAVMAYAGLRFGEVRDLHWSSVVFDPDGSGMLVIRRGGSRDFTKNKKVRRIPIHRDLRPFLEALPRTHARVFTARQVRNIQKEVVPLAGTSSFVL